MSPALTMMGLVPLRAGGVPIEVTWVSASTALVNMTAPETPLWMIRQLMTFGLAGSPAAPMSWRSKVIR